LLEQASVLARDLGLTETLALIEVERKHLARR
jgi:hypothetical protein